MWRVIHTTTITSHNPFQHIENLFQISVIIILTCQKGIIKSKELLRFTKNFSFDVKSETKVPSPYVQYRVHLYIFCFSYEN